ncbi:helix-turn-helix transcriptional regulator [Massilia sp. TS11]|uniref:AraC family transcriptional regulator n=1 Tax=Massilia sp. TS11 TaxID=2908003 RepID=UPI001EDB4AA0|nr:helix-turn-helix transcriptional regulator [Massilia sp. TS11]MCG2583366.1 helix-turn-helix transcriptional regulator [Massilia sp. TS11]
MALTILTDTRIRDDKDGPTLAQPVRPGARDLREAGAIRPHRHSYAQLTWARAGVMRVTAAGSSWIVPPERAIWIAPGIEHTVANLGPAQMRVLCVHPSRALFAGEECVAVAVSPLLREAMLALGQCEDEDRRAALLADLVLDELARSRTRPLRVPMPRDKRLQALCQVLLDAPGTEATLAELATRAGASERTMARLFDKELGMGFAQWRQQVRLAHAAPLIARGLPLARVAQELGYASQSAFSAMFKKTFGEPPSRFFARQTA